MAYGDIGALMPSEGRYRDPGVYGQILNAEGQKKSSYLANMDQFYAGLEETVREFNETLGLKEKSLQSEIDLEMSRRTWVSGEQQKNLDFQKWAVEQGTAMDEKKLEASEAYGNRALDIEGQKVNIEGQKVNIAQQRLNLDNQDDPLAADWADLMRDMMDIRRKESQKMSSASSSGPVKPWNLPSGSTQVKVPEYDFPDPEDSYEGSWW